MSLSGKSTYLSDLPRLIEKLPWQPLTTPNRIMFNPSRAQVREFFIHAWHKYKAHHTLTPIESLALTAILAHPEYHPDLDHPEALKHDDASQQSGSQPFLHLSLHLAIAEQLSIDQPPGICDLYQRLVAQSDAHQAAHTLIECLGTLIWEAQRLGAPLDNDRYLDSIRQCVNTRPLPG